LKRIVVTGTGTSIGKTHFTCSLARAYGSQKRRVAAFKPIETGVEPAGGEYTDSAQLAAVSSFHVKRWLDPVYTFREPISPHLAARRAGISLELQPIRDAIRIFDTLDLDLVLIELAGGLFSPLNDTESNADLALALHRDAVAAAVPVPQPVALAAESGGSSRPPPATDAPSAASSGTWTASAPNLHGDLPSASWSRADSFPPGDSSPPGATAAQDDAIPRVIVVAADRIGVLHEIATTTRAAEAIGLPLAGIVLMMPAQPDASTGLNGPEIPYVTIVPYLGTLRRAPIDALASDIKLSGFMGRLYAAA